MAHNKVLMARLRKILAVAVIFNFAFCGLCFGGFYRYNVDELARKARSRIKEIERKIAEQELAEGLAGILAEIQPLLEEGEALFNQRRYEEAAELYRKIDKISRERDVKEQLEKAGKY